MRCCSVAAASAATLREMNPLVRIAALPGALPAEPDAGFLEGFDVILVTGAPLSTLLAYDRSAAGAHAMLCMHAHQPFPLVPQMHPLHACGRPNEKQRLFYVTVESQLSESVSWLLLCRMQCLPGAGGGLLHSQQPRQHQLPFCGPDQPHLHALGADHL